MYSFGKLDSGIIGDFHINGMMQRYSDFVPRFYNLCKSLGFQPGKIMPSRAFCSDESQGFPIILLTKHFGTFPFNHGMVGGIVATDRHAPHATHGQDMVIIQASHVGYDPQRQTFGTYRRLQTETVGSTSNCGKICGVNSWYQSEYQFARKNIRLLKMQGGHFVSLDNQFMSRERSEGLFLYIDRMLKKRNGEIYPVRSFSTSKLFEASEQFVNELADFEWKEGVAEPIGDRLSPDLFYYKRDIFGEEEGQRHLEKNLQQVMPLIVTSPYPALTAAQVNTQVEFDRTYRTLGKEPAYQGKKLLFLSGLHIDISPQPNQIFPLTKFIPWAAYYQDGDGSSSIWEQAEVMDMLMGQSKENPDQIDLEAAIQAMRDTAEIRIAI
jgi:hypothetical protein